MTRRKIIIGATGGLGVLGLITWAGIADRLGILRADEDDDDDDEGGQAAIVRGLRFAKVSLQQGMGASEREGQPISGRFEVDRAIFSSRSIPPRTDIFRRWSSTIPPARSAK
jgi:hypothetical protein